MIKNKWILNFFLFTLLGLMNFGVIVTDKLANNNKLEFVRHFTNEITGAYTALALLPFLLWFINKYPIEREHFWSRIGLHFLGTIVFGLCHTFLMYITRAPLYQVLDIGEYNVLYGVLKYRIIMEYFKQLILYGVVYTVSRYFKQLELNQQQVLKAVHLEKQLSKARLQALQMQLNPHFLFNTLNMISVTMYEDPKAADKMIASLSDMLRHSLQANGEELQSLAEEMKLIYLYLEIMSARFKEKLETQIAIEEETLSSLVPVFLLQPLLENAIKYSVEQLGIAQISLSSCINEKKLQIILEDNGPGFTTNQTENDLKNGVGLSNTVERLENLYGNDYKFFIQNKEQGGVKVHLEIPQQSTKVIHEPNLEYINR